MGFHFLLWAEARPNIRHGHFTTKSMICLLLENQNFDLLAVSMRKLHDDGYFCNSLIGLYVRYKDIVYARNIFDVMRERDVLGPIWSLSGDVLESFRLFHEIRTYGIEPNSVTLVVVIRAFKGKKIVNGGSESPVKIIENLFDAEIDGNQFDGEDVMRQRSLEGTSRMTSGSDEVARTKH
ncbi:hypothetical protein M5K25_019980 [Dendrobium thyrsiflorum]|uniref:Pentatricopeptide repeat-containing protein n=1 Tax=Dendrobium thyrsiflorum TaxID=117978 RepID=A0ABD0UGU9_DENTH